MPAWKWRVYVVTGIVAILAFAFGAAQIVEMVP